MLSRTAQFTTMLLSPGIFRPKVRLHFSHLSPSGVGLPQQGTMSASAHIAMARSIKRSTANAPAPSAPIVMPKSSSCSIILWCATSVPCAISTPSPAFSSLSRRCSVPSRLMLHCCPRFHSEINSYSQTGTSGLLASIPLTQLPKDYPLFQSQTGTSGLLACV